MRLFPESRNQDQSQLSLFLSTSPHHYADALVQRRRFRHRRQRLHSCTLSRGRIRPRDNDDRNSMWPESQMNFDAKMGSDAPSDDASYIPPIRFRLNPAQILLPNSP